MEADVSNGRLLAFIESHTRIHDRAFVGDTGRVRIKAIMGKQTLADLSRNEQVEIVSTAPASVETGRGANREAAAAGEWRSVSTDEPASDDVE